MAVVLANAGTPFRRVPDGANELDIASASFSCQHASNCHDRLEFTMTAYIPALIWLLSGLICLRIAKRRHVKQTAVKSMIVTVLGPIAIPWMLIASPEKFNRA
jgi:hypothetical protein